MVNRNLMQQSEIPTCDVCFQAQTPIPPDELYYKFLTLDGDGTTTTMNVNGASVVKSFRATCPSGKILIINRVLASMADANIAYQNFMGLGAELSNGLRITLRDADDSLLLDFLHGTFITKTADFTLLAGGDVESLSDNFIAMRWTIGKCGYVPVLTAGQYLEFLVQDDLTLLSFYEMMVQGRVVTP